MSTKKTENNNYSDEFLAVVSSLCASRMYQEDEYTQHGSTSCLLHSIGVAYYSLSLARKLFGTKFCAHELIRGALLHDYFLYDWHCNPFPPNGLHGFSHPLTAWQNASVDVTLTEREENIIRTHMFPLTLTKMPKHRESVVVMLVDKACSLYEVFSRKTYKRDILQRAYRILKNKS